MYRENHIGRGIVAGLIAGLVACWVMNEFLTGPGERLQQAVQSPEENEFQANQSQIPREDATMKAADAIASTVTGGQHLSWEERERAGPAVHYAFGGFIGALYGGLAELWPGIRSGFGTTFGTILFTGADLIAVPILKLGPLPTEQPIAPQVSHLAAHLVYGGTTELVRRTVRAVL